MANTRVKAESQSPLVNSWYSLPKRDIRAFCQFQSLCSRVKEETGKGKSSLDNSSDLERRGLTLAIINVHILEPSSPEPIALTIIVGPDGRRTCCKQILTRHLDYSLKSVNTRWPTIINLLGASSELRVETRPLKEV